MAPTAASLYTAENCKAKRQCDENRKCERLRKVMARIFSFVFRIHADGVQFRLTEPADPGLLLQIREKALFIIIS